MTLSSCPDHLRFEVHVPSNASVVRVHLRSPANVLLMQRQEYLNYSAGSRYTYYGGYAPTSPVDIPVPFTGHWDVVIDLGGRNGHLWAEVSIVAYETP